MRTWKNIKTHFIADILAGATGAVAGAPQAMGFAIIAGISPLYGLYTAVVATIVGSLTTSSVYMTVGPTNAVALVVGGALLSFQGQDLLGHLITLTLMVGVFQLLFGVLKLGSLMRFVSNAVMTGFISGAALLIILGQLPALVGLEESAQGNSLQRVSDWLMHANLWNGETAVIGILSLVIIYGLHHTRFKSIATLVAMVITSVLVGLMGWTEVPLVKDLSLIPSGLPQFMLPNPAYIPGLATSALAIALLASLQAAGITRSVPQPDGSTASVRRDLIGQGLANIAASFFQSMPSGGSLSRTAVNVSAGARTRLANFTAGILVAGVLLALGSLIEMIPLASLSGHLIIAAFTLLRLDAIRKVWRVSYSGRTAMMITFISTLLLPLEVSIYIGIFISLLLYIYSSATDIKVVRLLPLKDNHFREAPLPSTFPADEPLVISVSGNLYFAAISRLAQLLPNPETATTPPVVILRLRDNFYLGTTGITFLKEYAHRLEVQGGKLILAGISDRVRGQLERTGEAKSLEPIFFADDVIFSATEQAIDYAKNWFVRNGTTAA